MNELCGCCEGIERLTPIAIANRPGLDALVYRVGTHASFLETMLARLSASDFPELRGLTIRTADDPSIALLDAWATVADVLTFYQERIANEGYLRTAIERRSILELARLVGYRLRPGVAASVYLAYTLEKDHDVTILLSNRAQSVPGPGELPQSFETAEKLEARFAWNVLRPRMSIPQYIVQISTKGIDTNTKDGSIYLRGTGTNLKQNDPVLFVFGAGQSEQVFSHVQDVEPHAAENFTKVTFPAILTPFVFYRDLLQIVNRYLDLKAFGISATDFRIIAMINVLKNLQQTLERLLNLSGDSTPGSLESSRILPGDLLQLGCEIYANAVKTKATEIANWIGRLITDVKNVLNIVSDSFLEGVCTPTITTNLVALLPSLAKPVSLQPASSVLLKRNIGQTFTRKGDMVPQLITTFNPAVGSALYTGYANADVTTKPPLQNFYALRVKAAPFGYNLPLVDLTAPSTAPSPDQAPFMLALDAEYKEITNGSWVVIERSGEEPIISRVTGVQTITMGGTTPGNDLRLFWTKGATVDTDNKTTTTTETTTSSDGTTTTTKTTITEGATSTSDPVKIKVTVLTLSSSWWGSKDPDKNKDDRISLVTTTTIYAQSEKRELAEEPLDEDISGNTIELDRLYDGLQSGRWVIVSGERSDIPSTSGVKASELVMLSSVTQDVRLARITPRRISEPGIAAHGEETGDGQKERQPIAVPGDKTHTFLHLANGLAYRYKRDTVTIYGNVVRATHGETRSETLGSGDGSKALQRFTLHQSPLTYLSAPTAAGAASTLQVRVNNILWHEADSLAGLGPTDRSYTTETDDASKTAVIFGNGQYGARLPTGVENVKAVYRSGIGKPGNVKAEQITLLATKPLGVKSVINPLRASGGADRESRDQARRNVPVALLALDRLVSVQDYADFARTYAGIGKASAVRLSNGRRQLVHLTIVGADNIPIDESSDLFQNLFQSLRQFGDPNEPLTMALAEVMFIVISAKVRLLPDYALEFVEPKIRAALLDFFSFERRELGQPVFQSEVFSVIQSVPGVDYVELEIMDAVDQDRVIAALDKSQTTQPPGLSSLNLRNLPFVDAQLAHIDPNATDPGKRIVPAQLAFLTPDLPDTLILTELPK